MSVNLTANDVASFANDAKDAYQGAGILRPHVRVTSGVTGSTHRFHKVGKGMAQPRIPQTEVIPMGIGHSNATATLTDWHAAEYTDLFDEQKVSYSERSFLAATTGRAITRREDQMILDGLAASGTSNTVAKTIGGSNALNLAKIRKAKRLLDDLAVPMSDRTIVVSPHGVEQMLGDNTNTSRDFSQLQRLADGEMGNTPWVGFHWIVMETRVATEGGLPVSGTDRTVYAFHKPAIGLANGMDLDIEVNYIPQFTSTLTNAKYIGGATAIDAEGICEITYDEAIVV